MKGYLAMATKKVCDICGGNCEEAGAIKIERSFKLPIIFYCIEWNRLDICKECAEEMLHYVKERRKQ